MEVDMSICYPPRITVFYSTRVIPLNPSKWLGFLIWPDYPVCGIISTMNKSRISDVWFYKYRYQIGYSGIFISYIVVMLYVLTIAPSGITASEMQSTAQSFHLIDSLKNGNFFTSGLINAPYKILQFLSVSLLGLSNFSIKLPSIILSIVSLLALIKLTNKWFLNAVATFASVIALTSSQFFFLSQNGTFEILYILYPILTLLLGAYLIITEKKAWLAASLALVLGLSLYTPLSGYIIVALALTVLVHPHLRFIIARLPKKAYLLMTLPTILIISPLAIAITKDLNLAKILLGLPDNWDILGNLRIAMSQLFSFSLESSQGVIFPLISPTSLILIGIGLFFALTARHTARSYLINIWIAILMAVYIINPSNSAILFVPIFILTVSGLHNLVHSWYTLFPLNPYARVAGLLPVSIFVVAFLAVNINSYRLNYTHSPALLRNFNRDLNLVVGEITPESMLITSEGEQDFYTILANQQTVPINEPLDSDNQKLIITRAGFQVYELSERQIVTKVLTSIKRDEADRFYIVETKPVEAEINQSTVDS